MSAPATTSVQVTIAQCMTGTVPTSVLNTSAPL
jgi:hypothetical protein